MFSGIIEAIGIVVSINQSGNNKDFIISSNISSELKVDQSIAHNGVCLTVVEITNNTYTVTAIEETLTVSNIGSLKVGDSINLERCIRLSDRLDGHLVQGHVDSVSNLLKIDEENGSWRFRFSIPDGYANLLVYKGSVCINGVSLTVAKLTKEFFEVAIIPYTYENTNFMHLKPGSSVNLEFDILGKYILRNLELKT